MELAEDQYAPGKTAAAVERQQPLPQNAGYLSSLRDPELTRGTVIMCPRSLLKPAGSRAGAKILDHRQRDCRTFDVTFGDVDEEGPQRQLHDQLRHLLTTADGEGCRVIATFIDIRGFSSFAGSGESFDTAAYLRSAFSTILTQYFDDVDFFKPTGDGLLLIHGLPSSAPALRPVVSSVLERCLSLVNGLFALRRGAVPDR